MTDTVTGAVAAEQKAEPTAQPPKVAAKVNSKKQPVKTAKKVSKKTIAVKKAAVTTKANKPAKKPNAKKRMGLLTAAFEVLCKKAEPMCIREIMEQITKRRLWKAPQGGKTPDRSLSAAIGRACLEKPARFRKVSKGKFTVKK